MSIFRNSFFPNARPGAAAVLPGSDGVDDGMVSLEELVAVITCPCLRANRAVEGCAVRRAGAGLGVRAAAMRRCRGRNASRMTTRTTQGPRGPERAAAPRCGRGADRPRARR